MNSADGASTWLEIDLDAIRNNINRLKEISGRSIMAVIKANAYGHGSVEIGQAASQAGVAWLGVARLEEALILRKAGIWIPILVLGYTLPERVPEAIGENIHLTLYDPQFIEPYSAQAGCLGSPIKVHLKVDTGMGRLGTRPEDSVGFVKQVTLRKEIQVDGLYTHFARADELDLPTTEIQLDRFVDILETLNALGLRPSCIHAANSAATLYVPESRFDLVRPGIAVYGLDPNWPVSPLPEGFRTALAWKARLASVKLLPPGHGIGYGHSYVTEREERIGVIPVGYADGFRRNADNWVLIHGKKLPVIRRVCMDNSMINLDSVPEAQIGDEVVLIGSQSGQSIRAEEIGQRWQTINYEVVCGLDARLPRVYLNQRL